MTLDKKFGYGVILALAMQFSAAIWWSGAAAERLTRLEREAHLNTHIAERLIRVEEQLLAARTQLERIETKLDGA